MPDLPRRPRVLFFVHDGGGWGHLRRLCRIAQGLRGHAACLIVTGHLPVDGFVPENCEFVHLPSWDNLLPNRARHWGREPFAEMKPAEASDFRHQILTAACKGYAPDVIVIDYLPLGKFEELADIIFRYPARKIFVFRGIMNDADNLRQNVLGGINGMALEEYYWRVLVTCDSRICNAVDEYGLSARIGKKLRYVGYVSDSVEPAVTAKLRERRGLMPGDRWVVCSAGSGYRGEPLVSAILAAAESFPEVYFDVVAGPKTTLPIDRHLDTGSRVRVHRGLAELPLLHAAADVVVSTGGYNTLMEALEGTARLLVMPVNPDTEYEQIEHARRLSRFIPIDIVSDVGRLRPMVARALDFGLGERRECGRDRLAFNGIAGACAEIVAALPSADGSGR